VFAAGFSFYMVHNTIQTKVTEMARMHAAPDCRCSRLPGRSAAAGAAAMGVLVSLFGIASSILAQRRLSLLALWIGANWAGLGRPQFTTFANVGSSMSRSTLAAITALRDAQFQTRGIVCLWQCQPRIADVIRRDPGDQRQPSGMPTSERISSHDATVQARANRTCGLPGKADSRNVPAGHLRLT
jgi:hypothetical protein